MKSAERTYSPHLLLSEETVAAGGEWVPARRGWTVLYLSEGAGYWLHASETMEWPAGSLLVLSPWAQGYLLASQVGGLRLHHFTVHPERLTGLLSLDELTFFEGTGQEKNTVRLLPANHEAAERFREAVQTHRRDNFVERLLLLRIFTAAFAKDWPEAPAPEVDRPDSRERLRRFLSQAPAAELLALSSSDLARKAGCTSRHLSRMFQELAGMSFSAKRTELRLVRAVELLATSESKVVDVAMESGYQSLSLFNLHFKRRYGVSPARWRERVKHRKNGRAA